MHTSSRLRAATSAVAAAVVALAGLVAVSPAASADEVLRTLAVVEAEGYPGVPSPPSVLDGSLPGVTVTALARQYEGSAWLQVRATEPGRLPVTLAELQLGAEDPLAPGTFSVTGYAQTPELGAGQARFGAGASCYEPTGTVTIHELEPAPVVGEYTTVSRLALGWDLDCVTYPRDSSTGEVRIASSFPVAAARVATTAATPPTIVLDERATSSVTFHNVGSQPAHLGQVAIADGPVAADWSLVVDACSGTTVGAGGSCGVVVQAVPISLRGSGYPPSNPTATYATVLFPHDLDDDPTPAEVSVNVLRVERPAPLTVVPLVDRTVLDLAYNGSSSGTRIEYSDASGPWQPLTTLAAPAVRTVDPRAGSADRRYRAVTPAPTGRPAVVGPPVSSGAAVDDELVLTQRAADGGGASLVSVDPRSGRSVTSPISSPLTGPPSLGVDQGVLVWGGTDRIRTRGVSETSPTGCMLLMCGNETITDPVVGPRGRYAWTGPAATVRVIGAGASYGGVDVAGLTAARHPAWARDGSTLVAASTSGGPLRTVRLDSAGAAVPGTLATVPGTQGATRPSASPQTDDVAYLDGTGAAAVVRAVPLVGGAPRTVAAVPGARHVSWTADGTALVVTAWDEVTGSTVERVEVAGGQRTTLYSTSAVVSGGVLRAVDRAAPAVSLGTPVLSRGRAAGSLQVSDDTRPVGDLAITCVLDSSEVPCSPQGGWSAPVRLGPHRLTVTVSESGRPPVTRSVQWETRTPARRTDLDGDGNVDLLARDTGGRLHLYPGTGTGSFAKPRAYGSGWGSMTSIAATPDLDGDGDVDLLAADKVGSVYVYPGDGRGGLGARRLVASGLTGRVVAPGDLTGDGVDDLFRIDPAGVPWVVPGDGAGGVGTAYAVGGRGWNAYTALITPGDMTGDSVPDLLVRDAAGRLHLFPVNQYGQLLPPVSYGLGWNAMTALVGPGDFNGDARPDLLARDTAGRLHLYPGNGAGGFGTRVSYGTGWNTMNAIIG